MNAFSHTSANALRKQPLDPVQIVEQNTALESLSRVSGPIYPMIDSHVHVVDFTQKISSLKELIGYMNTTNVKKAVVFGLPVTKQHLETERDRPVYYLDDESQVYYYSMTDVILAEEYLKLDVEERGRLYPTICGINCADRYAIEHIRRMFETYPGVFRGIGEVFFRHDDLTLMTPGEVPRPNNRTMFPVYEFCSEYGLPISVHHNITSVGISGYPKYLHELEEMLQNFPKLKVVFCHAGASRRVNAPYYTKMIDRLLREYPGLYVDYSWVVYDEMIYKNKRLQTDWLDLTERYSERVLIGSDVIGNFEKMGVINSRFNPFLEALTEKARQNVCIQNAERLWGDTQNRVEDGHKRKYPSLTQIQIESDSLPPETPIPPV